MNRQVEPPEKTRKTSQPPSFLSFSLLPDEIAVNCLARISRAYYPRLSIISKSFRSLLISKELYLARTHIGSTEQCLYVCLSHDKSPQWFNLWIKPNRTLTVSTIKKKKKKNKKTSGNLSLALIPSSDFPSVSESTLVVGSEIYVIGGPIKTDSSCPSSAVQILDCRTHTWRDTPSMILARNHALTCLYNGKIYVMGGCGVLEEPWAEVFDTNTQTWVPLSDQGTGIRNIGTRSYSVCRIKEIKGKTYFWNSIRTYAYDTSHDNWESISESQASSPCVIDGVWYFISHAPYYFRWTKDGGEWGVVILG
ncbi:unnamed protein product [Brassica oleracea]